MMAEHISTTGVLLKGVAQRTEREVLLTAWKRTSCNLAYGKQDGWFSEICTTSIIVSFTMITMSGRL